MAEKHATRSGGGVDITDNANGGQAPKGMEGQEQDQNGRDKAAGSGGSSHMPPAGAGAGGVSGAKSGTGMGTAGSEDTRNPDGSAQNRGPGTTMTVGKDTGQ
ncbi:hypothetical protein [Indioceanicola profundi]|uniref:hypothetical protein n=1 Tax=Indioceanicola profundi TaxID=2220096 RepID=UPI000E6AA2E4|nr:hypothetical protein [Indioceanicola profundi]